MTRTLIVPFLLAILNLQCRGPRLVQHQTPLYVFVLMGQSNMAGYGIMLPEDTLPVKGIFYIPTITKQPYQWMPARHPLHNRLPASDRFGLGLPFAKEIQKSSPGVTIGLIPVAYGGAAISQLNKGTEVYNDALLKARFAQAHGAVIKGVLWHQGESDTVEEELALEYQSKLQALISDFRKDLGMPDLPFIVGDLATFYGTGKEHNSPLRVRQINLVKQALRNIRDEVKNTGFVESEGGTSIDSHYVHFDRDSYILLGKRFAKKYNEMTGGNKQ